MRDLTTEQVAARLGCSADRARRLICSGKLKGYKFKGGNLRKKPWFVRPEDLASYNASNRIYNDDPRYLDAVSEGAANASV